MTSQPPQGADPWRPGQYGPPASAPGVPPRPFGAPAPQHPAGPPPPGGAWNVAAPLGGPTQAPAGAGRARKHGWYLVLAAAVLGVFVFCGIVVAAAGNQDKPAKTEDVARNGAIGAPIGEATASPGTTPSGNTQATSASAAASDAAAPVTTAAPATAGTTTGTKPTTTKPTTKPPTTKPAPKPTTKAPAQNCNPNYTPCVPNDPVDVDCSGGSGNGPSYVKGPVQVIGSDPYGLDTDHDGIGCE